MTKNFECSEKNICRTVFDEMDIGWKFVGNSKKYLLK